MDSSRLREQCQTYKTEGHVKSCPICSAADEIDRLAALVRSLERQKLDLITSPSYIRIR